MPRHARLATVATAAALAAGSLAAVPVVPDAFPDRVEEGSFEETATSPLTLLEQLSEDGPSLDMLGAQVADGLAATFGGTVLHPVWPAAATGVEVDSIGLGYDRSGDGVEDVLAVAYDHDTDTVTEYVLDGATGAELFVEDVVYHPDQNAPHDYIAVVTHDVTGDDIPDLLRVLLVEYDRSEPCVNGSCSVETSWELRMVSGADGTLLWTDTWDGGYDDTTDTDGNRRLEAVDYQPLAAPFHDSDGDGLDEIVLIGGTSGFQYEDGMYLEPFGAADADVMDRDGVVLGSFATPMANGLPVLQTLGDLIGDATVDYAWARYGWEYVERTTCPVADVTGALELLGICDTYLARDDSISIETVDGATLDTGFRSSYVQEVGSLKDPTLHTGHDLTGDGHNDIVAVSAFVAWSEILLFDGQTGALVWTYPVPDRIVAFHQIADFDHDGDLDIITDGGQWRLTFSNDPETDGNVQTVYSHVVVDGTTGELVAQTEHLRQPPGSPSFATGAARDAGDLDGDGLLDPIHNVSFGYDNGDGTMRWDTEARVLDGADPEAVLLDRSGPGFRRWMLAGDLTGDGVAEVVEFDHGHDRESAPTALAITHTGSELWQLPNAAGSRILGHDLLQANVTIDANHHSSSVTRRAGTDLHTRWTWEPTTRPRAS